MLRYLHIPSRDFTSFAESYTVMFMHGFGASAEDLVPLASMIDEQRRYNWVLPIAPIKLTDPQSGMFFGYGWFPRNQQQQQQAFAGTYFEVLPEIDGAELTDGAVLLEELRCKLHIPHSLLAIGGFSQGAIMSIEFLLSAKEPCAAALLFSGSLVAEERWRATVPHHTVTPFIQTHGRFDNILPFSNAKAAYQLLQEKGFSGTFVESDGAHTVSETGINSATKLLQSAFPSQLKQ